MSSRSGAGVREHLFDDVAAWLRNLYVVEISVIALVFALYGNFHPFSPEIDALPALVALCGLVGVGLGTWMLVRRATQRGVGKSLAMAMFVNLSTLVAATVLAETLLRVSAAHTERGIRLGQLLLPPTWPEIVALSERTLSTDPRARYFVHDDELGWVVGSSRRAAARRRTDSIYASSVEGLRASRRGERLSEVPAARRVALVGDSYTFGLEVPFEHTWGYHLENMLGEGVQVLNFGVDGYGPDQMLLRYRRDVVEWEPDVVVLTFVPHDLERTVVVYPMIAMGWYGYLVKPRFTLEDGSLRLLQRRLPSRARILGAETVQELPMIEWDPGFADADWRFRAPGTPLLLRLFGAIVPRSSASSDSRAVEKRAELNATIINEFVRSVEEHGAEPMVVFLPARPPWTHPVVAELTLDMLDLPALDLTECVFQVPSGSRRVDEEGHYTNRTNQAIATCLRDPVAAALASRDDPMSRAAEVPESVERRGSGDDGSG